MDKGKTITLNMDISEFEMPPMRDVIVIGTAAPIGPEAARQMVEALSPEQYEVVCIDDKIIEAMVVRKSLFQFIDRNRLIKELILEVTKIMTPKLVLRISINLSLHITKTFSETGSLI